MRINATNKIKYSNYINFKTSEKTSAASEIIKKNSEPTNINELQIDDEPEKGNNATALAIGAASLIVGIPLAYLAIAKNKGNSASDFKNKMMYELSNGGFLSLKDNPKIPTLESCKSIDEKLRKFLQRQLNLSKATPEELKELGIEKSSRKILLYGPAGVGKTHFAKIYAKTLGADYMEINYGELNERYTGDHIERIKNVFNRIIRTASLNKDKEYVVTFNEIDALMVPHQGLIESGGGFVTFKKEERNLFLNYLDEISEKAPNLTIIGTTNSAAKKTTLDEAGMSRFGAKIKVDYPSKKCLHEALKAHFADTNKGTFVRDNEENLENLAEKLYKRKTSFRNLDNIVESAKHNQLSNYLETKDTSFKFEFLKDAELGFDVTDGEAANVANSAA